MTRPDPDPRVPDEVYQEPPVFRPRHEREALADMRRRGPSPEDIDAMSDRQFNLFVTRIGMAANIAHAFDRHRVWVPLALVAGFVLGAVAGFLAGRWGG